MKRIETDDDKYSGSPELPWKVIAGRTVERALHQQYSPEQLLVHVSNRLAIARSVERRNHSLFGRLINKMAADRTGEIILDGQVLV